MKKKKGFTLIELLAVIVILTIIALIATPVILNIIEKSRKAAFTRSLESVVRAGKIYYMESIVDDNTSEINFRCTKDGCTSTDKTDSNGNWVEFEIDGNVGTGDITIDNKGNISFELEYSGYCGTKELTENKIEVLKGQCEDAKAKNDTTEPVIKSVKYTKGIDSIEIVVEAEDKESGIEYYEYSIDEGENYTEKQTKNVYTFEDLEPGTYKIKVKVYSGAYKYHPEIGMVESEVIEVTVEATDCPIPTIESEDPEGWAQEKIVTINYGNKAGCIGSYSIDGGNSWHPETSVTTRDKDIILKNTNGKEDFKITYNLLIEHESPNNITLDINEDTEYSKTKEVTVKLKDTGGSGLSTGSIKYGWSTSNTTAPNESSYTTVSTSATEGTNTTTFTVIGSDLTGTYYLWVEPVTYKDNAGNSNTEIIKSGAFNFDNEDPILTLGTATVTANSITVPITTNSDSHSQIDTTICEYSTDTSYDQEGTYSNNSCSFTDLKADTTYNYRVTTTDKAGNSKSQTGSLKTLEPSVLPAPDGKEGLIAIAYFNPTTGLGCTLSDYTTNLNNHLNTNITGSTIKHPTPTGLKSGCMKWYVYDDNGDGTVDMLLDHNSSTSRISHANKNSQLSTDTNGWRVDARLITLDEISSITGYEGSYDIRDVYFLTHTSNPPRPYTKEYSWLYDYTGDEDDEGDSDSCENYGCEVGDTYGYPGGKPYGYFTGTIITNNFGTKEWHVDYTGKVRWDYTGSSYSYIRPVVTVSKTTLGL